MKGPQLVQYGPQLIQCGPQLVQLGLQLPQIWNQLALLNSIVYNSTVFIILIIRQSSLSQASSTQNNATCTAWASKADIMHPRTCMCAYVCMCTHAHVYHDLSHLIQWLVIILPNWFVINLSNWSVLSNSRCYYPSIDGLVIYKKTSKHLLLSIPTKSK